MRGYKNALFAWGFFVVCTVILFASVPSPWGHMRQDSPLYERIAHNVAAHGMLADPQDTSIPPVGLGYPLLLGIFFFFCGTQYATVVLFNLLFALVLFFALYRIAFFMGGMRAGLIAPWLAAAHLGFLTYTQLMLTELCIVALITLFFERLVAWNASGRTRVVVQAALILGFSLWVKPIMTFFIPVIVMVLIGARIRAKALLAFSAALCAVLAPYVLHNYVRYGVVGLAPSAKENLCFYYAPELEARIRGESLVIVQQEYANRYVQFDRSQDAAWRRELALLWDMVLHNPWDALYTWCNNMLKTVCGLHAAVFKSLFTEDFYGCAGSFFAHDGSLLQRAWLYVTAGVSSPWVLMLCMYDALYTWCMYLAVCGALILLWRRRQFFILTVSMLWYLYAVAVTGHTGTGRYRLVIEPLMIAMVATVIAAQYRGVRRTPYLQRMSHA